MAVDISYVNGDNEFEDGNYVQESGCIAKVARALQMEQCTIDGILVGNGGYAALRREGNTASTRAMFRRYCEDVLRYFEETGQIEDAEVKVEGDGGAVKFIASFRDVATNDRAEVSTVPPWGV